MPYPPNVTAVRYHIKYKSEMDVFFLEDSLRVALDDSNTFQTLTLRNLSPDTEYTIQARLEAHYGECFRYFGGNYSDPLTARTGTTGNIQSIYVLGKSKATTTEPQRD